jgi:hypothetical protein
VEGGVGRRADGYVVGVAEDEVGAEGEYYVRLLLGQDGGHPVD